MIDRAKLYMPNFSSAKGECVNCGREMSDHDYISGKFICLANTKASMAEILATLKECEKLWWWDVNHNCLYSWENKARLLEKVPEPAQ